MCYICGKCKVSQLPRTPSTPIVIETRPMEYSNLIVVDEIPEIKVSKGFETVRELRVCPACAKEFAGVDNSAKAAVSSKVERARAVPRLPEAF